MILENDYEEKEANMQNLHFSYLESKFRSSNKTFDLTKLGFYTEDGKYNNGAYLFSDECNIITKYAVFKNINVFLDMKEFSGPIIKQLDQVLLHIDVVNKSLNIVDDIVRKEQKNYSNRALKEALCNCYCHQDYQSPNTLIKCYPECIEIINKSDRRFSLSKEDIEDGKVHIKNSIVYSIFKILGYTSFYEEEKLNGVRGIILDCGNKNVEFYFSNFWKVTLKNQNYEEMKRKIKDKILTILENDSISKEEQANRIVSTIGVIL